MSFARALLGTLAAAAAAAAAATTASLAAAQPMEPPSAAGRQSLDDAWWTGPMLANTPATAPPGHFLIETYLYDVAGEGRFDRRGVRRGAAHSAGFGSQTYVVYGLADRVAVGLIPTAGFNTVSGGASSSGPGLGDSSVLAQYRLTQFHAGSWLPTTAINVQETLPTGKYDRLGDRPSDGLGGGAYTTTLSFYSQTYFWLPNGRLLRMRLDLSQAFSRRVNIEGVSVYGTAPAFRGYANPGRSFTFDASWEYSLTRSWVLASDVVVRHNGNTRLVDRAQHPPGSRLDSGASDAFYVAPAIEYNWQSNLGVLLGVRLVAAGRNTANTVTPVVAINYVH
jgi:hypothetical protein